MSKPEVLEWDYPETVPIHETWAVMDSTKMKCYKGCPRRYFYNYVLGWKHEGPNIHLDFGSAIHKMFEYIYNQKDWKGYPNDIMKPAYKEFTDLYREAYPDMESDDSNEPKGPDGAARLLAEYVDKYRDDDFEVLYSEVAGTVPIDDSHDMTFKMDLIIRTEDGIRGRDFKTSSADREMYQRKFHLDTQMQVYTHALHMLFPDEEVGMALDFLIPLKTMIKLRRRDIPMAESQILYAIWELSYELAKVDRDFELLSQSTLDQPFMMAFPRNDQNCTAYNQICPYFDYCTLPSFNNPLTRCENPQPGMTVDFWDPRKLVDDAKHVVDKGTSIS